MYSSPAADESGNIYCSYYDATNGDLKLAIDLGYGWVMQTIDSKGDVGLYTSLAIDSNGNTFISYYDNTNHNLKFARWDSIEKVWVTETIDGNESTDVGWSTSLVIDSEGRPHISYYDFTHNKLKYATYALYYWVTMYVDDGGLYNSIGITSDGKPCIAYRDANGTLKYAEYHGKQGFRIAAAVKADPSRAEEYDLIWIPGGYAPDRLRRSREILELVRRAYLSGKVIAAVCHAPWVLISAGVIRGKKVAAFYAIHDDVKNAGGILVEDEAIRDGNLITGTGPEAMPKMFRLIKDALKIKEC